MKNLRAILSAIILFGNINLIKSQEVYYFKLGRDYLKNSFQASMGIKNWLNKEARKNYGITPVIRLEQEIKTKFGVNAGGSMELARKEKIEDNIHSSLELFQANLELKKYFHPLIHKKFMPYVRTSIGKTIGYEQKIYFDKLKPLMIRRWKRDSIRSEGYNLVLGVEIANRFLNWNWELNYGGIINQNLNNIEIATGFKFYF